MTRSSMRTPFNRNIQMAPRIATLYSSRKGVEDEDPSGELSMADRVRLLPLASKSEAQVYWESQGRDRLCGVHCLNTLLQGPVFTEVDLATVGLRLDEEERKLIRTASESNSEVATLLAGGSTNVSDDGFFSLSVLEGCLRRHGITITPSALAPNLIHNPTHGQAFVCHHHDHWFTVRNLHGNWYNLDSLRPAPSRIGEFYLGAFLHHLVEQGYSVFVVAASHQPLPLPDCYSDRQLNSNQFYLTDTQIDALVKMDKQYHQKALEAETLKYGVDPSSSIGTSAPAPSVGPTWSTEGGRRIVDTSPPSGDSSSCGPMDPDDESFAEAIKLSLAEFASTLPRPPQEPNSDAPNAITLQVRLPNEKRLVRRFDAAAPVQALFHWLELEAQTVISANTTYQLVASFPRRILRRIGRDSVEYETADEQIVTNVADKQLNEVVMPKQDVFMLQLV